jgi:hypothetical protein
VGNGFYVGFHRMGSSCRKKNSPLRGAPCDHEESGSDYQINNDPKL